MEVRDFELNEFAYPQTTAVKGFQNSKVAVAKRATQINGIQHFVDFFDREDVG